MEKINFKTIVKGMMTALSLIVSFTNIADFLVSIYRKCRKPKNITGFASKNETPTED